MPNNNGNRRGQKGTATSRSNTRKQQSRGGRSRGQRNGFNWRQGVRGTRALGTDAQGPQMLKTEQFATYTPLETFSVSAGSTPGGIRVRGRELIYTLTTGNTTLLFGALNAATAGAINLNPSSFPRLSAYNPIYEFFKFHKAKALFQSSQPTTTAGVSMLAVDYDPKDAAPTTTQGMMRNISSSMSNIYADNACVVSGALSRLPKFATAEATASDLNQVNQAQLLFAFEGVVATNAAVGYLLVEYDVEFFTPQ